MYERPGVGLNDAIRLAWDLLASAIEAVLNTRPLRSAGITTYHCHILAISDFLKTDTRGAFPRLSHRTPDRPRRWHHR
jgi:hypothetical protein